MIVEWEGKYKVLPVHDSISYTVWVYSHVMDVKVVAYITGKHDDIIKYCKPMSIIDSIDDINTYDSSINMTYTGTPSIQGLLSDRLLYIKDVNGNIIQDNFDKLFPEDLAIFMRLNFTEDVTLINKEFVNLIIEIKNKTHTIYNTVGYTYFQTFMIATTLTGGIKGVLNKYRELDKNKLILKNAVGKKEKHSLLKYIKRSKLLSTLREAKTTKNPSQESHKATTTVQLNDVERDYLINDVKANLCWYLNN
jgi:hypothetical protein